MMDIKKEWEKFVKFAREKHSLTDDWTPDFSSISIWCEYLESKKECK